MKERARNIAVGVTVIVALAMLAGMVLLFAGLPEFFRGGYIIRLHFSSTADAHTGDLVHLRGMQIGTITHISFTEGDPRKGVTFVARINRDINIPGNATAYIYNRGFAGSAYVELKGNGPDRIDPATGKVFEWLPKDGSAHIEGVLKTGVIPDELTEAIRGISKLADSLSLLIAPPEAPASTTQQAATTEARPATKQVGLQSTLAKLSLTLDSLHAVLEENKADIKTSVANLVVATAKASEAMDALKQFSIEARKTTGNADRRIDEITKKLIEDAEAISALMSTINKAAAKIESDQGTAGRLVNDPALYNSFLEAARQTTELMKQFSELVETWKKSGVEIKVK